MRGKEEVGECLTDCVIWGGGGGGSVGRWG